MKFRGYKIRYCDLCDTPTIHCSKCTGTNCNAQGCELCNKDIDDFNKWLHKHWILNKLISWYFIIKAKIILRKFGG